MIYLTTLLISVSLTVIIVRSKLTESSRNWVSTWSDINKTSIAYALHCCQCTGIYVGFVTSVCCLPNFYAITPRGEVICFVLTVTFGTSLLAHIIDRYLYS